MSDMPDIDDFIRRSRQSEKIAIAAPGTLGDFRRSRQSVYKIVSPAQQIMQFQKNPKEGHRKFLGRGGLKSQNEPKLEFPGGRGCN